MIKRVAIVGAESTGKTTLAQQLAEHFGTVWVPEYGREYTEVSVGREAFFDYKWRNDEFVLIAQKQIELEDQLAKTANRVLICDTDVLATCIWQERYMGAWSPEVEKIAKQRTHDLYLLTDCDIPFAQDGLRDGSRSVGTPRYLRVQGRAIPRGPVAESAHWQVSPTHRSRECASRGCRAALRIVPGQR